MMKIVFITSITFLLTFNCYSQIKRQQYYKEFHENIAKNDTTTALLYLDSLILTEKYNTDALLIKGNIQNYQHQYQSAVETFSAALTIRPGLIDGYVRRGTSYFNLEDYESAIKDFNTAIGKYPWQDSVAYKMRAICHLRLSNFEKAAADCDSALQYNSSDSDIYSLKGSAFLGMNKPQDALAQANKALSIKPYHKEALKIKCWILIVLQKNEEALSIAKKYISKYKDDSAINLVLGTIYVQMKQPSKSIGYLSKVSFPENESWQFFAARGMAYFFLADNHKAIIDFKKTLTYDPDNAVIHVLLADCYLELHESAIACDYLHKALALGLSEAERTIRENCK